MALPSNPQILANYDITNGDQAKVFVKKVSDLFLSISQTLTPLGLASILNGSGDLANTASTTVNFSNPSASTNQTVSSAFAERVVINLAISASLTLNITNLDNSVPVFIRVNNTTGGNLTFKIAGTNAAAVAFTSVLGIFVNGGTEANMTTTGMTLATTQTQYFQGMALSGTNLFLMSL